MDKEEVDSGLLVGHCMGGVTSSIFASLNPQRVQKLVLLEMLPANNRLTSPEEELHLRKYVTSTQFEFMQSCPLHLMTKPQVQDCVETIF